MDDGLVTHYMGCTGVSAINWLRHGNEYNEKSFSTTKNSVSFVSVNLSPWLPWASHLCTWSSSSAPGEQGLNSNQKGSSSLSLSMCRWNSPLSQSADTFDSSPVFPLGFPLSVWASASQQPVGQENYNRDEGADGEDWNWSKRINIIKWRVKKVRLDENIKIFIFISCFPNKNMQRFEKRKIYF